LFQNRVKVVACQLGFFNATWLLLVRFCGCKSIKKKPNGQSIRDNFICVSTKRAETGEWGMAALAGRFQIETKTDAYPYGFYRFRRFVIFSGQNVFPK